ncbi:hypothetical protein [Marilutibacter maris]|uniref:hypothetical protein n=1 Tax=Marilutibacter maris TaxID=1605891 RepID=UPI0011AE9C56|nr:hypothetical protein [Lysobacter maris]
MKEILEAGGAGFLLPAVLFVLVLYAARGVFGLHGRRGQHRREFLELWDKSCSTGDLWLEVSVRHLFGTYLPSHIIRLALEQPNRSRSLQELSEIWDLLTFNPDDQTVHWNGTVLARLARSRHGSALCLITYFALASAAALMGLLAAHSGHTSFTGWVYGISAVVTCFVAFTCLTHEETVKTGIQVGDRWITLINRLASAEQDQHKTAHFVRQQKPNHDISHKNTCPDTP